MRKLIKKISDLISAFSFNFKTRKTSEADRLSDHFESTGISDSEFVEMAYQVILSREPDPAGFVFYLERIQKVDTFPDSQEHWDHPLGLLYEPILHQTGQ